MHQRISNTQYIQYPEDFNPNLGGGGGVILQTSSWFSLNNSKMVQTVSLEFCSIQYHCIRVKFCTHYLYQFPDIRLNSDGSISNFRISGQSLIKENCHNSRTGYYIDMKLAAVARLDKKNKTKSKKV